MLKWFCFYSTVKRLLINMLIIKVADIVYIFCTYCFSNSSISHVLSIEILPTIIPFIIRIHKYSTPFVSVVTLLLTPHTITWDFIRWVPRTISFTKTQRMSSAIAVIPACESHLWSFHSLLHFQVMQFTTFLLLYFWAGVAQCIKIEWIVVSIFIVIFFIILVSSLN